MALRTPRRLVVRGRPPGRAAGRTGAIQAHAALVRSVSLNRECIVRSLWPASALFQDRRQLFNHPLRQRAMGDPTRLILVDEADRLKMASLEQMRAIFEDFCNT